MKFKENINITKTIKFTKFNLMNIPLNCKKKKEKIPLRHNSIFQCFHPLNPISLTQIKQ